MLSERTTRPGEPLLKEGMPVPEHMMINSANGFAPIEVITYKINMKWMGCNFLFYIPFLLKESIPQITTTPLSFCNLWPFSFFNPIPQNAGPRSIVLLSGSLRFPKILDNWIKNRYIYSEFKEIFGFPLNYGMDITSQLYF